MKAMGKGSVSSFLTVTLGIGWFGVAMVLAAVVLSGLLGSTVGFHISPNGGPSAEVGSGVKLAIPVSFHLDPAEHRVSVPILGIQNAQIEDVRGTVTFPPQRSALFYMNWIFAVALLVVALWVIWELRTVFATLRDGQPFVPSNARRIRRIAWAVIIGEIARASLVYFENYYAMTHFQVEGVHFDAKVELNLFAIVNGLIVLVVAEVFREGTRLNEEQSLTI